MRFQLNWDIQTYAHVTYDHTNDSPMIVKDNSLNATDRKMLKLLRTHHHNDGGNAADEIQDASEVNWQELTVRAVRLGIAPLIVDAMRQDNSKLSISAESYQTLQGQCNIITVYNLLIYKQLHVLLHLFKQHRVDVILLKGVFLAQMVYRNIGLRPMSDIDLLARPEDMDHIRHLLGELGYTRSEVAPTDDNDSHKPDIPYCDSFSRAGSNVSVEIHWMLESPSSPFTIDNDEIWKQATAAQIAGLPVYLLSPVDTLLHQCIHVSYHHIFQRFSLRSLCDIQYLIDHYGSALDWHQFCKRAAQWQAQRSVHLALLVAHNLLQVAVPSFVFESLRPAQLDERLQGWAAHRVLGKVDDTHGPWSLNVVDWHYSSSWSEKLAVAFKTAFPPRQQIADQFGVSLKSPRLWFGYLQRWAKVGSSLFVMERNQLKLNNQDETSVSWREREIGRAALIDWLYEKP